MTLVGIAVEEEDVATTDGSGEKDVGGSVLQLSVHAKGEVGEDQLALTSVELDARRCPLGKGDRAG